MNFFIYGIFIGVAAATRRNDHLYLAVLAESMTGDRRLFFETVQPRSSCSASRCAWSVSAISISSTASRACACRR